MKIVIATGGTGGHIFPALSLLDEIKKKRHQYLIIADKRFNNFRSSMPKNVNSKIVCSGGLSGGICKRFISLVKIFFGIIQTVFLFIKFKPNIVVSFGGYPAFPSMVVAKLMMVPLLVHEPNSVVGQANKLFINSSTAAAHAFRNTKWLTRKENLYLTGTPVRSDIIKMRNKSYPKLSNTGKIKILIIGGSQGARVLSEVLPEVFAKLPEFLRSRLDIVQQCRREDISSVKKVYQDNKIQAKIEHFFVDMAQKLQEAHIVICRAGATTIAELFAIGRPAVFIPIAGSKENHQMLNAEWVVKQHAGWLIQEKDFKVEYCVDQFEKILKDYKRIELFAQHARGLFLDSSNILLNIVEKYCTSTRSSC